MKIDQTSMYHRLFKLYGSGNMWALEHDRLNFCQYSRRVGVGAFVVLLCIVSGVFLAIGPLQFLASGILWMFTDNVLMWFMEPMSTVEGGSWINVLGVAGMAVMFLEALVGVIAVVVLSIFAALNSDWIDNLPTLASRVKKDGFLMTWYKSKKEKYCPMVTLHDEDSPREVKTWPVYGDND